MDLEQVVNLLWICQWIWYKCDSVELDIYLKSFYCEHVVIYWWLSYICAVNIVVCGSHKNISDIKKYTRHCYDPIWDVSY
jgi:hypothetical protein